VKQNGLPQAVLLNVGHQFGELRVRHFWNDGRDGMCLDRFHIGVLLGRGDAALVLCDEEAKCEIVWPSGSTLIEPSQLERPCSALISSSATIRKGALAAHPVCAEFMPLRSGPYCLRAPAVLVAGAQISLRTEPTDVGPDGQRNTLILTKGCRTIFTPGPAVPCPAARFLHAANSMVIPK